MEDFTGLIHLDSNVIDDRCNNTPSSFKNYLSSTYRYNSESYEAGLLEIHIPFTWTNVKEEQYICILDQETGGLVRDGIIPIRSGYYEDLEALLNHCNEQIADIFYVDKDPKFFDNHELPTEFLIFDEGLQRIITGLPVPGDAVALGGEYSPEKKTVRKVMVMFTSQLASILGYTSYCFEYLNIKSLLDSHALRMDKRKIGILQQQPDMRMINQMSYLHDVPVGADFEKWRHSWHLIARFQSDKYKPHEIELMMRNGQGQRRPYLPTIIDEMFIYCSLIKPHTIGNTYKQLLRVTPVVPPEIINREESIVIQYQRPYYFPLYHTAFDYIEIELRDRAGELIEFDSGGVLAILEIRKRKNAESIH